MLAYRNSTEGLNLTLLDDDVQDENQQTELDRFIDMFPGKDRDEKVDSFITLMGLRHRYGLCGTRDPKTAEDFKIEKAKSKHINTHLRKK